MNHLQAFHIGSQRRILGVRWFHKIKNADITRRTGLPHIGDINQKRKHALFDHVVHMNPQAPALVALKLCRDIAMGRRVPLGWKRPRGRPRTTWSDQLKRAGETSIDTLDPGSGQIAVDEGRDSLTGIRDLAVVVVD